jgi:hypothetical protein
MFVIGKQDSVFYMKLKEYLQIPSEEMSRDLAMSNFTSQVDQDNPHIYLSSSLGDCVTTSSVGSVRQQMAAKSQEGNCLMLKVYGVDPPGEDLTEEFVSMLQSKLTVAVLNILGTFLARSTAFKLTKADIYFLLPIDKEPMKVMNFHLPPCIQNISRFLFLLKQNLQSYLCHLSGGEVEQAISKFARDHSSQGLSENKFDGVVYLYRNSQTEGLSPNETSINIGMASLLLYSSEVKTSSMECHQDISLSVQEKLVKIRQCLEEKQEQSSGPIQINTVVWTQGIVQVESLVSRLYQSFKQSIYDYITGDLSAIIKQTEMKMDGVFMSGTKLQLETISLMIFVLDKSVRVGNLAVSRKHIIKGINNDLLDLFVKDVSDLLHNISVACSMQVISLKPASPLRKRVFTFKLLSLVEEDLLLHDHYDYAFICVNTPNLSLPYTKNQNGMTPMLYTFIR